MVLTEAEKKVIQLKKENSFSRFTTKCLYTTTNK